MPPPPWLKTKSDNIIKVLELFQAFDPLRVPLTPWLPEGGREGGSATVRGREGVRGRKTFPQHGGRRQKDQKKQKNCNKKGERGGARKGFAQDGGGGGGGGTEREEGRDGESEGGVHCLSLVLMWFVCEHKGKQRETHRVITKNSFDRFRTKFIREYELESRLISSFTRSLTRQ